MPIQNVGDIKDIISRHDAKSWVSKANFNEVNLSDLQANEGDTRSFGQVLMGKISEVNNLQIEANKAVENLITGRSQNLHETMLAVEQAEIAFRTLNQVRQKVLDAYQEIMRMQV